MTMNRTIGHKPPLPEKDVPDEFDPEPQPVEPDEGPVPAFNPEDPEHGRKVGPDARQILSRRHTGRQVEPA